MRDFPSLDEPDTAQYCEHCGSELHLVDPPFCGFCAERKLEELWPDETPLGLALGGYEEGQ